MKLSIFKNFNFTRTALSLAVLGTMSIMNSMAADHVPHTFKFFNPDQTESRDTISKPPKIVVLNYVNIPKTVSALGFFTNMTTKAIGPGFYHFEVNNPLWSDGAHKSRYLIVPNGKKVTFVNDTLSYVYPESTTILKNFAIDTIAGDSNSRVFIETRLLVKKDSTWYGFSYKWRKDQTDADLIGGERGGYVEDSTSFSIRTGNIKKGRLWHWPSRQDCYSCHIAVEKDGNDTPIRPRHILGFITQQLNRNILGSTTKNQIQDMVDKNFMAFKAGVTFNAATSHKWYALDDTAKAATLERKARSYLASNCSYCHSPEGKTQDNICFPEFNYFTNAPLSSVNYINTISKYNGNPLLYEKLKIPESIYLQTIYGGNAKYSSIVYRISAFDSTTGYRDDADKMPRLATFDLYPLSIQVISAWANSLPPTSISAHHKIFLADKIRLENNMFYLPKRLSFLQVVKVYDVRGKASTVVAYQPGIFIMPTSFPNGMYTVIAGAERFYLPYFR